MGVAVGTAVGSALLASGASFAVASAVVTALPAIALAAGAVVTSQIIAERNRAQFGSGYSLINDDRGLQQDVPLAAPEHLYCSGYATLAGRQFFKRGGEANRPYFWVGKLLAAHECDGLDALYINNTRILIDPLTGYATSSPFNDGAMSFIEVSFRNGHIDQAIDPIIARDFPDIPSTFRQRGHCTIVIKAHYGDGANAQAQDDKHKALYGDNAFNPISRVRGAKPYDPRDPNQDANGPSTWVWTQNAVLNIAHNLCLRFPEMRARMDWAKIKDEAEICDRFIATKAGEKLRQYTMDGVISSADDASAFITSMLSSCGGQLIRTQGKIHIMPAHRKLAVGTLSLKNHRGGIQYHGDNSLGETVNEVRPEFMSPERNFKIIPGPVIRKQADVDADGVERPITARFPFTERHERAQPMATRIYKEGRVVETVSTGCNISALKWEAGHVIMLDMASLFPKLIGAWEILTNKLDKRTGEHQLNLRRYDETSMDFDAATEEQDFVVEEIAA